GDLPWHLSEDLKFFKKTTMGKPIIMGRVTFDSIGRPLPGRPNYVVTRNSSFQHDGVTVFQNLEEAIESAKIAASEMGVNEVMIIGGAQIYNLSLNLATKLYVTEIDLAPEGDAYFPEILPSDWEAVERIENAAIEDQPSYDFVTYERKR
ncbi:MAG: dihydrofolate reductase, partial [Alphaproteobacteria bacterium]|nr:dihydrofolate reductase [Alphaproteobacteria bacterium]